MIKFTNSRKLRSIIVTFLLFIFSFQIHSSMDEGIIIRYKNFQVECRYDAGEPNVESRTILDLFKPDRLAWTFANWVDYNKKLLRQVDDAFTFYFSLEDGGVMLTNGEGELLGEYIYELKEYSGEYFTNILSSAAGLKAESPPESRSLKLYMIYSEAHLDRQWLESGIFIGPLPGNMVTMQYGYTLFFWEKRKFKGYFKKLGKDEYNFKVIRLTKENINDYMW